VEPLDVTIFETKYAIRLILYLHRQDRPVATHRIVESLGVSNWVAISKALHKLEKAGLITVQNARVGRKRSPAKLWWIESGVGVKVAEALEEVNSRMTGGSGPAGRPAIASTELEQRLVTVVRRGLRKATGA
jgi:biotin operon repressor